MVNRRPDDTSSVSATSSAVFPTDFHEIDIDCSMLFTVTPNETTRGHAYKLFVYIIVV